MMMHRPRGPDPPWVPAVDPPNALMAPRGGWLLQLDEIERRKRTAPSCSLSLPHGFTMNRTRSDASAYSSGNGGATTTGSFRRGGLGGGHPLSGPTAGPARPQVAPLFGPGGLPPVPYDGDPGFESPRSSQYSDDVVVTPQVSVQEEGEGAMQLDQILQGLELNVAPTPELSPVNFVDDAVLDLPTREFAQFLKTVDPQTATAIKAARRRKKNREYAKGSRERRKERGDSPSESPRDSMNLESFDMASYDDDGGSQGDASSHFPGF